VTLAEEEAAEEILLGRMRKNGWKICGVVENRIFRPGRIHRAVPIERETRKALAVFEMGRLIGITEES